MMEEKVDEHELSPNKTELVCVAEARDDIVKELDDMKQCIVRGVKTILNNISTELQSTIATTVATMLEQRLKKLSKEESADSD
jgi:hypothetical protein